MKLYNNIIIILFLHGFFFVLANFILIIIGLSYLVGQFLLRALAESCGGGYSGPLQPDGAAVWGAGGVNQGEHGGLCLAGLLASTPGLRPWSRDMRGNYRSSWHFLESCLSFESTLHVS